MLKRTDFGCLSIWDAYWILPYTVGCGIPWEGLLPQQEARWLFLILLTLPLLSAASLTLHPPWPNPIIALQVPHLLLGIASSGQQGLPCPVAYTLRHVYPAVVPSGPQDKLYLLGMQYGCAFAWPGLYQPGRTSILLREPSSSLLIWDLGLHPGPAQIPFLPGTSEAVASPVLSGLALLWELSYGTKLHN